MSAQRELVTPRLRDALDVRQGDDAHLVLRRATVLDPVAGIDGVHDVVVRGGEIVALAAPGEAETEGAEVVEAEGLHAFPAFFDPHVHLRTPGQEHKEDVETGTRAAAESVAIVRAAKAAGVQVSAEASPHHLCLTDEEVRSLDPHRFKMNPPIREERDRQALIEGLRDGTVECIATDHAPHQPEEKDVPFEQAAFGVTGLETAFAALHTELVLPGTIDIALLIERMAGGAEPFDLPRPTVAPGSEANVVLCDLGAEWTVGEDGYESRSANSWCAGKTLTGRVLMTVAAGQVAFRLRSFSLGVAA
jgi:dihydroorotase-like cyclic amidohydrolase